MKTFVCLAGFPQPIVEEIHSRPAAHFTEAKDNTPIARALREPYAYRCGMEDFYHENLAKRVEALKIKDEVSIILVYANYVCNETKNFVGTFFPFALCAPINPMYPDKMPKHIRRSTLMTYVDEIEKTVARAKANARIIRDTFSGQPMSPLLLPLRNFKSDVLSTRVRGLFDTLPLDSAPRPGLKDALDAIKKSHPISRQSGVAYYEDQRKLRFKSPGTDRHGAARLVGAGHKASCLINGRVRLGAPIDALFHYDCDYERKELDREYPNCHCTLQKTAKTTHANIAPSDAIR